MMDLMQDVPCPHDDKENAKYRSNSSPTGSCRAILSQEELQTMTIKIRGSIANIPDNCLWKDHEGLIEGLVQLSFTMKSPKENVLLKRKLSVPLLNSCRKLVKESTVSKDNKVAFRLLRAAIHGIRAIVAAEGKTVPKPEAIIKLLYHIISTLESVAHQKHSISRLAAYYTVLAFETLGLVLRTCCSDFVDKNTSKTIQSTFPVPGPHWKESLSLSLSKEQLLTIGNHVILACSRNFLLPLWHTSDTPLRMEEELILRCMPVAKKQTPLETLHLSAQLVCTVGRPWLLQLHALNTDASLKESIALSRRAHKILWDCVDGYEEMIGPDAVLTLRKHSIDCLLTMIPRNAHEMKRTEKELFRTQFASACSQASKAILVCDQLAPSNITSLRMILEDISGELDSIAKLFDGAEIASYLEFCAYRALYGSSVDHNEKKHSDDIVDTCIFDILPYRFQCKDPSKVKVQIDYASLSIVFLALDVVKAIEHDNACYQDMRVVNFLLNAIQNFETMLSADPITSNVGLQFWFKILYKTYLNRMISKAAEGDDQNPKSHPALFLAAQLLHRCYWSMAKVISSDTEGPKKSSVWDFGCDCVIKSIVAYQKLEFVEYRTDVVRSCLMDIVAELCSKKFDEHPKFQERAAKLFALHGKSLIDKDVTDGAIDSMLHSVRLLMHLSQNGVSDIQFQVSLRWSAIGSTYMNMNRWEEATVAFIMALLQDAEESASSRKDLTGDCWLAVFKFLGSLSNGIFHTDHVEERFQSPRRLRLIFKTIQCTRELGNVREGPSISWESLTSPMDVVDMLLGSRMLSSEQTILSVDGRSRFEDMLSYLFRIDGRRFSTTSKSAQYLEYVALLFLLYKQIQKEAGRDGHQEPVCCFQRALSCLLDEKIRALIGSSSRAFFGELLSIMLDIHEVCESSQIPKRDLAKLVSSLGELGRCPEGGWDLVILSFRLSLQTRILIDGNACDSESFDDMLADARRFSIGIGPCLTAEGSFARACATGAMLRLQDYLITNGFDLSASLCALWCREHSAKRNDMLVSWYDSFANVHLSTNHVLLVNYSAMKAIGSASHITEDRELAMRASSFLAAVSQARSSVNIMHMRNELDILFADAESLLTLQNGDVHSLDDIAACWVKSTILLGRGELEKICGNYVDAVDGVRMCFSECNRISSHLVSHISANSNDMLQLKALRSLCTMRQISCLRQLCTIYHLIGDYRRAWGYAQLVWNDFSGIHTITVPPKASLSETLSIISSQICRSPLQKLLRRNMIVTKIRSSPLDVAIGGIQGFLSTVYSDGEPIVDNEMEDLLDSQLVWETLGSEYSCVSCEAIHDAEQLTKRGADALLGTVLKLVEFTDNKLEIRRGTNCRPLLDLDMQLRSIEYRLHRHPLTKLGNEERFLVERMVADHSAHASVRGRSLYILGCLSLSSAETITSEDSLDLYNNDTASSNLAHARQYFVSALQIPTIFSPQKIRDIYRFVALASIGDGVSDKSICRFIASSIGRCLGRDLGALIEKDCPSLMKVSAVDSELNIQGTGGQKSLTAHVVSDEAFDQLERLLPSKSRIIMTALAPTGELLASSIRSFDGCLSYKTAKVKSGQQPKNSFYDEFLKPLDDIICKSHEQLGATGECSRDKSNNRNSKKIWWELRQQLDSALLELLTLFEHMCCNNSGLQSIFGVNTNSSADTPRRKLISRFEAARNEDRDTYQNRIKESPSNLKVLDLREELISYGFETKRIRKLKKNELVELVMEQRKAIAEDDETVHVTTCDQEEEKETIFLILDENLQRFPFENLSCFRGKSVCRMPSLTFMVAMLRQRSFQECLVDKEKVSYVIDPESNLAATRDRLHPLIFALSEGCGNGRWRGVVGRLPDGGVMREGFLQRDGLLLYIGHGGGESLLSRSEIASLSSEESASIKSSVILMGCSSGRLESVNRRNSRTTSQLPIHYEPEGIALSYLLAGAPCVVGNLWDVTDGDIDRYTEALLTSMFDNSGRSIAQCVSDARDACKMKYLVGCAPVCYGLPVFVRDEQRIKRASS